MKRLLVALFLMGFLLACATPMTRINDHAPTVKVFLKVDPPAAKVFLDGYYVGQAKEFTAQDGGLALTAGVHVLRLEAEGYISETLELVSLEEMRPIEVHMLEKPVKTE